jgi:hypothetical protein
MNRMIIIKFERWFILNLLQESRIVLSTRLIIVVLGGRGTQYIMYLLNVRTQVHRMYWNHDN